MLRIRPPSARRLLSHLTQLRREGQALLEQPELSSVDECRWDVRVWKCLDKVAVGTPFNWPARRTGKRSARLISWPSAPPGPMGKWTGSFAGECNTVWSVWCKTRIVLEFLPVCRQSIAKRHFFLKHRRRTVRLFSFRFLQIGQTQFGH